MDLKVRGRTFIITGGSKGLGFATAKRLVDEGAAVVISARGRSQLDQAVAELNARRAEPGAIGVPSDLGDPETPERLIHAATATFGRVDGALVSVGGPPAGTAAQMSDDEWRAAFDTIFLGAIRVARLVISSLTQQGGPGAVGFVLSSTARAPFAGLGLSNGLRPGLAAVAKDMADEFGPKGVRVFSLLPHRILTDRNKELFAATGDPIKAQAVAEAETSLRRLGDPDEFGAVAAFMLSPAASYLTGCSIPVDGGAMRFI